MAFWLKLEFFTTQSGKFKDENNFDDCADRAFYYKTLLHKRVPDIKKTILVLNDDRITFLKKKFREI